MAQLVQKDAQGPHIDGSPVVLSAQHLRGHVLGCATKRLPLLLVDEPALRVRLEVNFASPAEVAQLYAIVLSDKKVLRL